MILDAAQLGRERIETETTPARSKPGHRRKPARSSGQSGRRTPSTAFDTFIPNSTDLDASTPISSAGDKFKPMDAPTMPSLCV